MNISPTSASALLSATSDKSHNNAKPAMQRPLSSINLGLNNAQPASPRPVFGGPIKAPIFNNPALPRPPEHGGPVLVDQTI